MTFTLSSSAFQEGETIPRRFTCDGQNHSPELHWSDPPPNTRSFVLILNDPDAPRGTFTHWVLFNISAETRSIPEAAVGMGELATNDFGEISYSGPCPPHRHGPHRYYFTLYALDALLPELRRGDSHHRVETAMQGHILGQAQLMGRYERP